MTDKKKNAELGRAPAGTQTDPKHADQSADPSLFQLGHRAARAGTSAGVDSPLVDPTDYTTSERDRQIYAAARARMTRSTLIEGDGVELESDDGVVHLRGEVRSPEARRQLVTLVAQIPGVEAVHDHLHLRDA